MQRKFASPFRKERQKGKAYAVLPLERRKGSLLVPLGGKTDDKKNEVKKSQNALRLDGCAFFTEAVQVV